MSEIPTSNFREKEYDEIIQRKDRAHNRSALYISCFLGLGFYFVWEEVNKSNKIKKECRTPIVESYLDTGPSLEKLRTELKQTKREVSIPYQTEEIKKSLEEISFLNPKKISILEETITKVTLDSINLSKHEDVKNYDKAVEVAEQYHNKGAKKFCLSCTLGVVLGFLALFSNRRIYSGEMKKFREKYSSE